jgi:hypothetical protein
MDTLMENTGKDSLGNLCVLVEEDILQKVLKVVVFVTVAAVAVVPSTQRRNLNMAPRL